MTKAEKRDPKWEFYDHKMHKIFYSLTKIKFVCKLTTLCNCSNPNWETNNLAKKKI